MELDLNIEQHRARVRSQMRVASERSHQNTTSPSRRAVSQRARRERERNAGDLARVASEHSHQNTTSPFRRAVSQRARRERERNAGDLARVASEHSHQNTTSPSRRAVSQRARRERERNAGDLARSNLNDQSSQMLSQMHVASEHSHQGPNREISNGQRELPYQIQIQSNQLFNQNSTSMTLSRRAIAQRARRERERREQENCSAQIQSNQLFNQNSTSMTLSRRAIAQRARRERERRATAQIEEHIVRDTDATNISITSQSHLPRQPNEKGKGVLIDIEPPRQQPIPTYFMGSSSTFHNPNENMVLHCVSLSSNSGAGCSNANVVEEVMQHFVTRPPDEQQSCPISIPQRSPEIQTMMDDFSDVEMEYQREPVIELPEGRHFLGRMNVKCQFCSALHWLDEKLSKSSYARPMFGMCCLQGKIMLPPLLSLPHPLQELFEGSDARARSFRQHIRSYNASNAFTSLGVKMDNRVLGGRGPTPFTIHGELYHQIGSLLPAPGNNPVYAQLYIYDARLALDHRQTRNPHLRRDVLSIIQQTLLESNELCKVYKHAYEILASHDNDVVARLHYTPGTDRRRYNLPSMDEIAIILPGEGGELDNTRDIILHLRNAQGLQRISECHPAYLPSHYVLMFPYGELGWSPDLRQWDSTSNCPSNARLTQLHYYAYRLFHRPTEYSAVLRGGLLFQEFLVDAWAACEQNRLRYIRTHQSTIRAELYQGLTDVADQGLNPNQVGRRIVLPSSHLGSPRSMYEIFQDSMAITRYNKHPDIFLTATANPNWPEIVNELKPFETASLRPDLVARVFELKRRAIMREIIDNRIFGRTVAHVYTIEFQKRGLPHMHALFFLQHDDKIRTPAQVDQVVCAEFPDPETNPALFETVKKCMVHGPCGPRNPRSPCMQDNRCRFKYPRAFVNETTLDQDGYPLYKRRNTGRVYMVRGHEVDNRDVVPYNPHLSAMFDCHINVEVCASVRAVKYIHKYIYKGHDRTTMILGGDGDEIQQYIDARYIGPTEAAWRLFQNSMHEEVPNVVRLAVHLPGMHNVLFNDHGTIVDVIDRAHNQTSTLMGFFNCCAETPLAREFTYQEFPQHFVWNKSYKIWTPRQRGFAIGRMYFARPNEGERFYLRLLLTVVKGPMSFESLRTVSYVTHNTFKEACVARGLLEHDDEWIKCLEEAAVMKTGYQLRRLFSVILLECLPIHPQLLWNRFSSSICDDIPYKLQTVFQIQHPTEYQVKDYGLFLLQELLAESGKTLSNFPPMPLPEQIWNEVVTNKLIWEQRQLQYEGLQEEANANVSRLNEEQRHAYNMITTSVTNDLGKIFFLNGPAGTGKTFLYNTIAASCRSLGYIVIMVASSGIASLLLVGGRTAHSRFCIPFEVMEDSVCGFTKQSMHAGLFREAKLIIWDEVPMQHRHCVEAVDRTLQDICDRHLPFGGITVVLGGDFRQTLPVIPKGVREQFVGASIRRSRLWNHVEVLNLVQNMRLDMEDAENVSYANFLLQVGTNPCETIQLPPGINYSGSLEELIFSVYPRINVQGTVDEEFLRNRTILAPRNDDVRVINEATLSFIPGELIEYMAADKLVDDNVVNQNSSSQYPTELLNSLDPSGLPPFKLKLKVGCPIMLLRNIAPKDGLCNGTRLMVVRCASRVIQAKILTGDRAGGDPVFIPRISLAPSNAELPFQMSRRQFPIRLAYAMTVNKSQGQSVKYVGIDLQTPVFSHGQLYVALSRCTSSKRISIMLPPNSSNQTTNIVYPESVLTDDQVHIQNHRARVRAQIQAATKQYMESWDRFLPPQKPKDVDNNGWGRWPMVRTKCCLAGYTTPTRLVCDLRTYDRLKKRLPLDHPIHRSEIEYVDYWDYWA